MNAQLQGCILRLQEMNQSLQIATTRLQHATRDFPRLQSVTRLKRKYDLVTEGDIREAKDQIADEVEPQIINLLSQAEDLMSVMEIQRDNLTNQLKSLDEPSAKNESNHQSNVNRLKALGRKKQRLMKDLERMQQQLLEKENLLESMSSIHTPKRKEENPFLEEKKDTEKEDHYQKLVSEFELLNQALEDRKARLEAAKEMAQRTKKQSSSSSSERASTESMRALKAYQHQATFLRSCDGSLPGDTLTKLSQALTEEHQMLSQDLLPKAKERCQTSINQLKSVFKLFLPHRSLGETAGRVMERLLLAKDKMIPMRALAEEFPPNREERHQLQKALAILKRLGIVQMTTEEGKEENRRETLGELMLRIQFSESTCV